MRRYLSNRHRRLEVGSEHEGFFQVLGVELAQSSCRRVGGGGTGSEDRRGWRQRTTGWKCDSLLHCFRVDGTRMFTVLNTNLVFLFWCSYAMILDRLLCWKGYPTRDGKQHPNPPRGEVSI